MASRMVGSLAAAVALVLVAGVGAAVHADLRPAAVTPVPSATPDARPSEHRPSAHPSARRSAPVRPTGPENFAMGGTAVIVDPAAGLSETVRAHDLNVSTTSLSPDYGYSPIHGYYVSIDVTITNTGSQPVVVNPLDFQLIVDGVTATVQTGNAPVSGASSALDSTAVDPGTDVGGPLTFDVSGVHGTLEYLPAGSLAASWQF
ncbi:MAG TPA: DUF4352 domain-containing protein [Mycobacteriales bacterium]|nr:DUF4352 domain-containing protein [Mycobacteriales bacterium]